MAGISHQRGCFLKLHCLKTGLNLYSEFRHFTTLSGVVINFNSNLHEELIGVKEWHLPYLCHEQYAMRKQSALTSDRHPCIDINASNEHEAVGFLGAKPDPFVVVVYFLYWAKQRDWSSLSEAGNFPKSSVISFHIIKGSVPGRQLMSF